MMIRLHLLPWDRPLLPQAVGFLAAAWQGDGPLDLAELLVVVPTRQSGRRLREALAAHAAAHGQAVFSPRVVLPDTLAALGVSGGTASRAACLLAWIEVLRGLNLEEFRAVFPMDPPARDFAWARRLAARLLGLQAVLAEGGLRVTDVAARAGPDFPEAERWEQLARLEQRYDAALAVRRMRDPQAAKLESAAAPVLPAGIRRIVVLGTPDPLPLAGRVLEAHAARLPVEIVVAGPADEAAALFDGWGRPLADVWAGRELNLPRFEDHVRLLADPEAQAAKITALAQGYTGSDGVLAVGLADPEVEAPLEDGLGRAGIPVFNPEGRPRRLDGLFALLSLLADLARDDSFAAAQALVRCPAVLDWLEDRAEARLSRTALLGEMDELQADHLPPSLEAARAHSDRFPLAGRALAELARLREVLTKGAFPDNAQATLAELFAGRPVPPGSAAAESAAAWLDATGEIGPALAAFPGVSLTEAWELALAQFAETLRFEPRPAGALDLNGWLELLWEDAPHLVVAGLNDGAVPEAVTADAFLPETLRLRLGLKTNAQRFARDAYLLAALAAARAQDGRLDLLVGQASLAGEPLRPSRLLLRCPDADLPRRVDFLFREVGTTGANIPWTRSWQLRPRRAEPPKRVSVTALRDYLKCPFRFYLRHVLRMEPVDPAKAELDPREFGTLLHRALQIVGEDERLRDCTDEAVMRSALLGALEREIRARYGTALTLPLMAQFESARQRLRRAAAVQAEQRAAGWRIERVEWAFELALGGLAVRGKIDRIDRHEDGRVRVLDYKTADSSVDPAEAHLGPAPAGDWPPAWARVGGAKRERAWIDLQLPLYRLAVGAEFGPDAACGYFNLPKAVGETAVILWEDFPPGLQAAAETCAERVAAAVSAGIFWPPAEPRRPEEEVDEWPGLFHRGTAASVAIGWSGGAPS